MKTANLSLVLAAAMAATVAMGAAAYAATPSHDHADGQHAQVQAKHEGYGVLKAVNVAEGKLKIAHEPIPALEWPAMTMWFTLRGALPAGIKAGDAVRFELQQENGKWVVDRIAPGK